ncbi:hypothetical protein RCL1_002654 [Eukaryota sp. TZLM3-RCL]
MSTPNISFQFDDDILHIIVNLDQPTGARDRLLAASTFGWTSVPGDPSLKIDLNISKKMGLSSSGVLSEDEGDSIEPEIRHIQQYNTRVVVKQNLLYFIVSLQSSLPNSIVTMREQVAHLTAEDGLNERPELKVRFKCERVPLQRGASEAPTEDKLIASCVKFNKQINKKREDRHTLPWAFS